MSKSGAMDTLEKQSRMISFRLVGDDFYEYVINTSLHPNDAEIVLLLCLFYARQRGISGLRL